MDKQKPRELILAMSRERHHEKVEDKDLAFDRLQPLNLDHKIVKPMSGGRNGKKRED